MDKKCW